MRTLNDHTILYDANCPMCRLYTGAFVKAGLLDAEGRLPYQGLPEGTCPGLDRHRAVNEIALVDRKTGAVTYGVASLFKILGHRWPPLRRLFAFRPFAGMAARAYAFISYNRRVIVPARADASDAPPAFSAGWRAAWIIFSWLLSALILNGWSSRLQELVPAHSLSREILMCGGQIFWQATFLTILGFKGRTDYLGNLMTVSLAGSLALLLLGAVLDAFSVQNSWVAAVLFGVVVVAMLLEHLRRCQLLDLPWTVSASWVAYRMLLLYFIIY